MSELKRIVLIAGLMLGTSAMATVDDGIRYYNSKEYTKAVGEFLSAAADGDSNGQYWLALLYEKGLGVTRDYKKAASWYIKAADQGDGIAQYKIGAFYEYGWGVKRDYKQAAFWYRLSAESGYSLAASALGFLYYKGLGVKKDYEQAMHWYIKAEVSSSLNSVVHVYRGMYYENVDKDYAEAALQYAYAAEKGLAAGQFNLGRLHEKGLGMPKDLNRALEYYQKAAAQNHVEAKAAVARLTATLNTKKRVALLIGNQAYPVKPLINPINDVAKLSAILASLGFTVTVKNDLNRLRLVSTIQSFLNTIDRNTVSFLYYSGHGMEVAGRNYLIPIDFSANSTQQIRYQAVDIQELYDDMPSKSAGSDNFLVLDACRDNPFAVSRALGNSNGVKSIAMRAPFIDTNLVVAYAASSGQTADDGVGNSPYVLALNKELLKPNISWTTVFGNVSKTLRASSRGRQAPEIRMQGVLEFVFNRR